MGLRSRHLVPGLRKSCGLGLGSFSAGSDLSSHLVPSALFFRPLLGFFWFASLNMCGCIYMCGNMYRYVYGYIYGGNMYMPARRVLPSTVLSGVRSRASG